MTKLSVTISLFLGGKGRISMMFNNDPVWSLLNRILLLNSRFCAILFSIGVGGLTFFLLPFFTGYLFPRTDGLSSLSDIPGLLITFFTHPAIYLYYCFEQEKLINELETGLAGVQLVKDHQCFVQKLDKSLNRGSWSILAFLLATIGYVLHTQAVLLHPAFSYYYPNKFVLFFVNAPLSTLAGYMICLVSIRYLIVVISLFKSFRNCTLNMNITHPDGCGGFSFVGRFVKGSFVLTAIMAIDLSLLVAINLLQTHRDPFTEPSFMSLIVVYALLLLAGFIIPLFTIRSSIRRVDRNRQFTALPFDKTSLTQFTILFAISLVPVMLLAFSRILVGGAL